MNEAALTTDGVDSPKHTTKENRNRFMWKILYQMNKAINSRVALALSFGYVFVSSPYDTVKQLGSSYG